MVRVKDQRASCICNCKWFSGSDKVKQYVTKIRKMSCLRICLYNSRDGEMKIGEVNSGGNFFLDGSYNPMKVQDVDKGV